MKTIWQQKRLKKALGVFGKPSRTDFKNPELLEGYIIDENTFLFI